ncbi:MAG TPA: hypothetical protein VFI31_06615 [Pirellulales bacterium]|nr:hypothetical protein [Pirellulales bacterium]
MRIAWLGLLDIDDIAPRPRAQEHLARLASHVVAASQNHWEIALISCGGHSLRKMLGPGVERLVLPVAGGPSPVWDRVSWLLPQQVMEADVVHLHDGFSRSCEVAWLAAKPLGKPVCLTEWGVEGPWLSTELCLREMADAVFCHSERAVQAGKGRPVVFARCDVELRQLGVPAPWPAKNRLDGYRDEPILATDEQYAEAGKCICQAYQRLTAHRRRAAA